MDKYEFNLKVEQLKKMVKAGDYDTAMKIADEIDWRRVSSVSLLSMVSEVYEKKNDIEEAREILLLAYDRAPVGKRILYKLTLLSLQLNDIAEAETFYKEFYKVAPDDPRQHILRYLVLKAKGAPAAQLINSLEQYNLAEPNEHWMYELAETYYRAGRIQDCVRTCDELMLMFGIGSYVDKAVELKTQRCGQPLTEYQMNLISKRDSYENSPVSQETMVLETPLRQEETAAEISEDDMDAEIAAHMAQLDHELDNPLPARQTGFGFGAQAGFGAQPGFGTQAGFGAQQGFGTQQGFGFEAQPMPQPEMQPMPAVPMPGIAAAQPGFGFEPKPEFQPGFESEPQPMSQPGFGFEPKSEFQPTPDTASAQQPAMNTAPAQQPKTSTAPAQQPAMNEEKTERAAPIPSRPTR